MNTLQTLLSFNYQHLSGKLRQLSSDVVVKSLILSAFCFMAVSTTYAQQWDGPNNTTSEISRMGNVGIGIADPARPLHLRGSNTVFQLDRDTKDPGFGITRWSRGFGEVWKSFYFYTEGTGPNQGRFIIADWGQNVKGLSTPRLVIDNEGNIGVGTLNSF